MHTNLDIQGHRGCRGLYPENTIPAFIHALELGVNTLELDVCISKDNQVIISHEPFFNHEISLDPTGNEISEENEKSHNLFQLTAEQIKQYDVGLKPHPRFPYQKKLAATKPLLKELFTEAEKWGKANNKTILYNIEIKRKPENDGIFHPPYETFTDLVMEVITASGLTNNIFVQCFDHKTLKYLHQAFPDQKTVLLVEDTLPIENHLERIGFIPTIYSPNESLVNPSLIAYCHKQGIQVIPWTTNDATMAEKLIKMGIDGIISDYPDMIIEVYESLSTSQ